MVAEWFGMNQNTLENQCMFCRFFTNNPCPKEKIKSERTIEVCVSYRAKPLKIKK